VWWGGVSVPPRAVSSSGVGSRMGRARVPRGTAGAVARRGRVVRATTRCTARRHPDGVGGYGCRSRCWRLCGTRGVGIRCRSSTPPLVASRSCQRRWSRCSPGCAGGWPSPVCPWRRWSQRSCGRWPLRPDVADAMCSGDSRRSARGNRTWRRNWRACVSRSAASSCSCPKAGRAPCPSRARAGRYPRAAPAYCMT
jgi:hypothetical protein